MDVPIGAVEEDRADYISRAEVSLAAYVNSYSEFEWSPADFADEAEAVVQDIGVAYVSYMHNIDNAHAVREVALGLIGRDAFTPERADEAAQALVNELGADMLKLGVS